MDASDQETTVEASAANSAFEEANEDAFETKDEIGNGNRSSGAETTTLRSATLRRRSISTTRR